MTKANDPGKANGELAVWIDGKLCSHQKGIRFRPTADVKLKRFNIGVFVSQALRDNIVWYDDLALSTGYIGPMKEGSATPMPPLPEPQLSTEYIGPRKEAAAQAGERILAEGCKRRGSELRGCTVAVGFPRRRRMMPPTLPGSGSRGSSGVEKWLPTSTAGMRASPSRGRSPMRPASPFALPR